MAQLPSLKALQAFRYAGETLSFKVASERLFVTQAAISQQIKTLERQLGVRLFERKTRAVALTDEGQRLYNAVRTGFETIEATVRSLTEDRHPNQLNISTMASFASRWLVPKLGRFQTQQPGLTVNLSLSQTLSTFDEQSLDAAVRFGAGAYDGLQSIKLFDEYLIPVCHASLLSETQPIRNQLEQMPVLMDDAPDVQAAWDAFEERSGLSMARSSARLYVSDANMVVEAVLSGQGLSLLPFGLIHELLYRQQLICPWPVWVKSAYNYYLVAPPAHFKYEKIKRFQGWLQQEFSVTEDQWRQFRQQLDARAAEV